MSLHQVGRVENAPMKAIGNPLPGPASNPSAERAWPMMPLRHFGCRKERFCEFHDYIDVEDGAGHIVICEIVAETQEG